MIKDDYSAKVSEEFLSLIKEIGNLNNLKSEVLTLLDSSFKKFVGISSGFANTISDEDLLKLMEKNHNVQGSLCAIAAALLFEEGKVYERENNHSEAYSRFLKGFNLILNIFTMNLECEIEGYKGTAFSLANNLEKFELFPEEQKKLFTYYNLTGVYSKAEDYLYELLDNPSEKSFALESIKHFYNNLLKKSDKELTEGNLPREEVLEAMSNFV